MGRIPGPTRYPPMYYYPDMLGTRNSAPARTLLLISLGFCIGCAYHVEEELYPQRSCNLENLTYSETVVPILEANCLSCHSRAGNQGGITLEGYDALIRQIDNGRLLGAIRHEAGFSPMPKDRPRLLDCQISQIEAWIAEGAPNN